MARKKRSAQIDLSRSHLYHVVSRCTRQLHLLGGDSPEDAAERKDLLLHELERLATYMAVSVAGFAVMDNHVHLLLRIETEMATDWSADEVARRWLSLHPPRNGYHHRLEVTQEAIDAFLADNASVEAAREKLASISQFMKEFKQEIAQKINKLDQVVGSVWAGRFKCNAVTSDAQLMATLAYIDLNPFAAGVGQAPEDADHTSLGCRLGYTPETPQPPEAPEAQKQTPDAAVGQASQRTTEKPGWWLAVGSTGRQTASKRKSLWGPGVRVTWGGYLKLLDATARLLRPGKQTLKADAPPIRVRLQGLPVKNLSQQICRWVDEGLDWAGIPGVPVEV